MKIKLAILDDNKAYLAKLSETFSSRYADKFEIYGFTSLDIAEKYLSEKKPDIFLASENFDVESLTIPAHCGFAYLVDSQVDIFRDKNAISRFQKVDLIYKQLLSIYAEVSEGDISRVGDSNCHLVVFSSPAGGTGTSSVAAAFAVNRAKQGSKVLYLNLETFGSSDDFFAGEGQFSMSDVIFAIKSKNAKLSIKLESCVKQDASGVYFYSMPNIALDMLELDLDEKIDLIEEIKNSGQYDYLVVDVDFALSDDTLKIFKKASSLVWVCDGEAISNTKTNAAFRVIEIKNQNSDAALLDRLKIVNNRFSSKTGLSLAELDKFTIGGAPRYEHASVKEVVENLSKMDFSDKI